MLHYLRNLEDKEELQQGSFPSLYRQFTEFTWQRYTKKWKLEDE